MGGMAWIAWIRVQDSMACGMCIASGHRHVVGGVDGREAQSGPELSAGAAEIAGETSRSREGVGKGVAEGLSASVRALWVLAL